MYYATFPRKTMTLLRKEQILGYVLPTQDVSVPELGGDVRLRIMTGEQRDKWDSAVAKRPDKEFAGLRSLLVSMCAVDENGKSLFTAKELDQAGSNIVNRLFDAAFDLNKLGGKAVEEAAKNSSGEKS
jgi:hypothetical protein